MKWKQKRHDHTLCVPLYARIVDVFRSVKNSMRYEYVSQLASQNSVRCLWSHVSTHSTTSRTEWEKKKEKRIHRLCVFEHYFTRNTVTAVVWRFVPFSLEINVSFLPSHIIVTWWLSECMKMMFCWSWCWSSSRSLNYPVCIRATGARCITFWFAFRKNVSRIPIKWWILRLPSESYVHFIIMSNFGEKNSRNWSESKDISDEVIMWFATANRPIIRNCEKVFRYVEILLPLTLLLYEFDRLW